SPKMSIRSVTSVRTVSTNLSAYAFARGQRGGIFTTSTPAPARTASNDAVNCPARSRTRNRKSVARVPQVHHQVADLLHGPRPVRVRGDPEDVHVTGADLHDEQAVQAPQGHRAVHVEEVGGEHRR